MLKKDYSVIDNVDYRLQDVTGLDLYHLNENFYEILRGPFLAIRVTVLC